MVNIKNKKERIFYYDEIRALAILFVILIHTSKWFAKVEPVHSTHWIFSASLAAFGNIGVPLFMMLSGALLLNRKYELSEFFKKRFSRIFLPFTFWIIFIILYKIFIYHNGVGDIIDIIFFHGFVWFVWTLCGIYLFIPIVNSYINEFKIKGAEYFLLIWSITIILNTLGIYPIKNIELRYFSGYLGYLILGWYLSNKEFKLNDKSMLLISIIVFLISTILHIYCINMGISFKDKYLTVLIALQAFSLYLFFRYVDRLSDFDKGNLLSRAHLFIKKSRISKAVVSISICSYGMYLTHYFLIWTVRRTNHITHILNRSPYIWIPIVFISAVLFSWCLIWVCSRIPYIKKVCGT